MKKLFFFAVTLMACTCVTYAQSDCSYLYPNTKGTTMTTKCYDAQNQLLSTVMYEVSDETDNFTSSSSEIVYSMKDKSGNVVNAGVIENYCDDGNIYMKTRSKSDVADITKMLSANINLMGSYLDYPNTFPEFDGELDQEDANLTLRVKDNSQKPVRVRIYNREYEKNESITTPAGTFDASKITFRVEVYNGNDKTTKDFKHVEWYSLGKGIIRAESYDKKNQLLNYTVLTALNEK